MGKFLFLCSVFYLFTINAYSQDSLSHKELPTVRIYSIAADLSRNGGLYSLTIEKKFLIFHGNRLPIGARDSPAFPLEKGLL